MKRLYFAGYGYTQVLSRRGNYPPDMGLGFRVWGLGFRFWVLGLGFRVQGSGFRV